MAKTGWPIILAVAAVTAVPGPFITGRAGAYGVQRAPAFMERCAALRANSDRIVGRIEQAGPGPAAIAGGRAMASQSLMLPAHCEIRASFPARDGRYGQHYAVHYHMRLPEAWNGRFLFQGGGGTNGEIGDAAGWAGPGLPPAIVAGYAVVSQDSGHDNVANNDPARGGVTVFGSDPIARRDYGHASLPRVALAAKTLISRLYGRREQHSYFFGCSKGGQEGMAFAQRYPEMFDGIVAAAPGMSLPRAALAQSWDVQSFAPLIRGPLTPTSFAGLFSSRDFLLITEAVAKACDGLDGLEDGIVGDFRRCTRDRVLPVLESRRCPAIGGSDCLARDKLEALDRSMSGPRDGHGQPIYADWPWDLGVGSPGWTMWKLGNATMPSLNILTGGASLPMVFMTPPRLLSGEPASLLAFQMALRFPRDAAAIYATNHQFPRSSWQDIAMRSPDLDRFRAHGGRMIIPHGVSDPVFSINDTVAWRDAVDARYRGRADAFVRLFPVPGMNHCGGGPATGEFDTLGALVAWVEKGRAPERILATAARDAPWPGRQRPLCSYPRIARYRGEGSTEVADSFACVMPSAR